MTSTHEIFPLGKATLELRVGDITLDDSEAIVNPTRKLFEGGGLVDLAVHRAAGPELAFACRALARQSPPDAPGPILAPGFSLRARFVILLVTPAYESPSASSGKLAAFYRDAIDLARERQLSSIAFPSVATGVAGYPLCVAAPVAVAAVAGALAGMTAPFRVRIVLFGPATFDAYARAARARSSP